MGVSDASTIYKKQNNFTPSNQHYTSFDSSKILENSNLSKNLKEVLSANIDKKITPKLNIINSTNCFNLSNNNTKNNNTIHYQKQKLSYLKNANISKTVDKKLTNNNIIKNNIFTDSNNITNNKNKNNSSRKNKNNISTLRENSKKGCKSKEKSKNNNIKNKNKQNNSS